MIADVPLTPDFPVGDELAEGWDDSIARWDDGLWARILRQPFTWQIFLNWWVARRYVMPRDPKKW